jgi:hypothetical protein
MLEPDFDPVPTAVQIGRCGYHAPCRAPRCVVSHATIVLRKIDAAGRPVRQIELCDGHAEAVIARERNAASRYSTAAIGANRCSAGLRYEVESGYPRL